MENIPSVAPWWRPHPKCPAACSGPGFGGPPYGTRRTLLAGMTSLLNFMGVEEVSIHGFWVFEIHLLAYLRIFFVIVKTNQPCETILRKKTDERMIRCSWFPPQATSSRKTGIQLSRAGFNRNAAGSFEFLRSKWIWILGMRQIPTGQKSTEFACAALQTIKWNRVSSKFSTYPHLVHPKMVIQQVACPILSSAKRWKEQNCRTCADFNTKLGGQWLDPSGSSLVRFACKVSSSLCPKTWGSDLAYVTLSLHCCTSQVNSSATRHRAIFIRALAQYGNRQGR